MGCDGGTIPKRKEIVKNKERQPRQERNSGVSAAERWQTCAITDWILTAPIVAGHYGHLFSKEGIIEYLLEKSRNTVDSYRLAADKTPALDSIHNLRDVKELKLMENPDLDEEESSSSQGSDAVRGKWVCPITGLETNGKFKFFFSWRCGCVVSERAITEVPDNDKCLVCQKRYTQWDLVQINPETHKELEENQAKFLCREMKKKMKGKGMLKPEHDNTSGSSQETASTSFSEDPDNPQPGTSGSSNSSRSEAASRNNKRSHENRSRDRADGPPGGPSAGPSPSRASKHRRT